MGEKQYRFVACTSYQFHQVYLDTFRGGEALLTSIKNALTSVSLFNATTIEGKLEILIWGKDSGYEMDIMLNWNTIAHAALNWHLEVVKYLRQLDISWNKQTCANAAKNGHLELLKWARANQCPWDEYWTCTLAAENGHLELLKWVRVNQCPWIAWTCAFAAVNGHLEVLKWVRVN